MKKKKRVCLLLAVFLLGFSACGGASSDDNGASMPSSWLPRETAVTEPMYPVGQLRFYGRISGLHVATTALNTNFGLYETRGFSSGENTTLSQIWVTEYATREYRILCDEAGCAHSEENCSAWLPTYGNFALLEAAGKLALVGKGNLPYSDPSQGGPPRDTAYTPAAIYTMGYGGKGRALLCTFAEREILGDEWITDDTYLYGIRIRCPENMDWEDVDSATTSTVVKIDLVTGEVSDLCELGARRESLIGVLNGKLLTRCTEYPVDGRTLPDKENDAAWPQNDQGSWIAHYTIDTKTGERTKLPKEYTDVNAMDALDGECYYYSEEFNPQTVYKVHLPTGETTELYTCAEPKTLLMGGVVDGKLFLTITNQSLQEDRFLWIDLATGEPIEQKLFFIYRPPAVPEDARADIQTPVIPLAGTGGYYLVRVGQRVVEEEFLGTPAALILKEDYWAGKENYLPIVYTA